MKEIMIFSAVLLSVFVSFFPQTFSVLNPLKVPNVNLARDTDLTGPLIFCLLFGVVLLLVSSCSQCTVVCFTYKNSIFI